MDRSEFSSNAPGQLVPVQSGAFAFVPHPLPPDVDLSELHTEIETAALLVGELRGTGYALRESEIILGPLISREAVYSSRIEGTIASAEQLALFEADPATERSQPDVREVGNYSRALRSGLKRLSSLPVSLRLLREVHQVLMEGVRGEDKRPGEFRTEQNWIGRTRFTPIEDARFAPPPATSLSDLLANLERYANQRGRYPAMVDLALIHYQFETIHPFRDGNGRVGRLLIALLMAQWEVMPRPLLHLSPYFESHRSDYVDLMLNVSRRGEWAPWVAFFLEAVKHQTRETLGTVQYLLRLRDTYLKRVQTRRSSALASRLVEHLFRRPALTIPAAAQFLGVTYRSAQLNMERLASAGIVRELQRPSGPKVYVATEIVNVSQGAGPETRG